MILDDDQMLHDILVRLMRLCADPACYDVVAVATPQAALAQVLARPVPLLLTDYHLDGTTGLHVATQMQQWSPATTTMVMSAALTPTIEALARAHRITHLVPKPVALATLQQMVAPVLTAWEIRG